MRVQLALNISVAALKAMAEPTRLRLLVLLASGELSVKDLTGILGQSQPRVSRHLRLLTEAGLVKRAPEGAWVFFRLAEETKSGGACASHARGGCRGRSVLVRDRRRDEALREERDPAAPAYFERTPATGTACARCIWRKPTSTPPCPPPRGRARSV